jgi:hypothetical protein
VAALRAHAEAAGEHRESISAVVRSGHIAASSELRDVLTVIVRDAFVSFSSTTEASSLAIREEFRSNLGSLAEMVIETLASVRHPSVRSHHKSHSRPFPDVDE